MAREKLCLSNTTEFRINDQTCLPLMVTIAELNDKMISFPLAVDTEVLRLLTLRFRKTAIHFFNQACKNETSKV